MMTLPPPARASMVMACMASVAGGRAASWAMAVPSLIRWVEAGQIGEGREGVGAVGLGAPHRVVSEVVGRLDQIHGNRQLGRSVQVQSQGEVHGTHPKPG